MNEFQLSSLANESACRACANCCKSLLIWIQDSEGMAQRIDFLNNPVVSYKRTGIFVGSVEWIILVIDSRCVHLLESNGGFGCSIWDSDEKPQLCRSYPSNQFYDFVANSPFESGEFIERTLSVISKICPALEGKKISDVRLDHQWQQLNQVKMTKKHDNEK